MLRHARKMMGEVLAVWRDTENRLRWRRSPYSFSRAFGFGQVPFEEI